jgi:hypothetical protein
MKNLFTLLAICMMMTLAAQAQEAEAYLDNASSEYTSGNLENARFNLQQMLQEINVAIGRDILALLPDELANMQKVAENDNASGINTGYAGIFVNRSYTAENRDAAIEIVSDSPLLSGINILLNMPIFIAGDPNQKRIKIDGQKALLTKNTSTEGTISYNVQMAFGSTLLTFNCSGVDSENEVTAMLNTIPIKEIQKVAQ